MIEARPYQARALDAVYRDLQIMPEVLLVGIMGAGKTFMSCRLIQRLANENPEMRFLILAHKRELIDQFRRSFEKFTTLSPFDIGICCAGLKNKELNKRVTIASIQTFVNLKFQFSGAGLIIIDECHRIDINGDTQYKQTLDHLRSLRPSCRILGITATPFRLGLGYCYGDKIKKGATNLFPVCNHQITYAELESAGHLVPLRGLVADHKTLTDDLETVTINGDYVNDQLGEIMTKELHLKTCADAIHQYLSEYDCICVMCVNIDHAEKLHAILPDSTIVHSRLNEIDRMSNMTKWEMGEVRIMVSVEILIEGYDLPRLKAIVFARPTLSPSLYLQAVGRVLRTAPGKDHGFLLDVTDNTARFGTDLDNIKVTIPKSAPTSTPVSDMFKLCPNCEVEVHKALRECPECGFEWPEQECVIAEALPAMKDVEFKSSCIVDSEPEWFSVDSFDIEAHTSKKNGNQLGKITYFFKQTEYKQGRAYMWLCFEDYYDGYAVMSSRQRWDQISNDSFPESVGEFLEKSFRRPINILLDMNGKYPELKMVDCEEENIEFQQYEDEIPF